MPRSQTGEQPWLALVLLCSPPSYQEGNSECVAGPKTKGTSRASVSDYFFLAFVTFILCIKFLLLTDPILDSLWVLEANKT